MASTIRYRDRGRLIRCGWCTRLTRADCLMRLNPTIITSQISSCSARWSTVCRVSALNISVIPRNRILPWSHSAWSAGTISEDS